MAECCSDITSIACNEVVTISYLKSLLSCAEDSNGAKLVNRITGSDEYAPTRSEIEAMVGVASTQSDGNWQANVDGVVIASSVGSNELVRKDEITGYCTSFVSFSITNPGQSNCGNGSGPNPPTTCTPKTEYTYDSVTYIECNATGSKTVGVNYTATTTASNCDVSTTEGVSSITVSNLTCNSGSDKEVRSNPRIVQRGGCNCGCPSYEYQASANKTSISNIDKCGGTGDCTITIQTKCTTASTWSTCTTCTVSWTSSDCTWVSISNTASTNPTFTISENCTESTRSCTYTWTAYNGSSQINTGNVTISQEAGKCDSETCNPSCEYEYRVNVDPNDIVSVDACGGSEQVTLTVEKKCTTGTDNSWTEYEEWYCDWTRDSSSTHSFAGNTTFEGDLTFNFSCNDTSEARKDVFKYEVFHNTQIGGIFETIATGLVEFNQSVGPCSTGCCDCSDFDIYGDEGVGFTWACNEKDDKRKVYITGASCVGVSCSDITISGDSEYFDVDCDGLSSSPKYIEVYPSSENTTATDYEATLHVVSPNCVGKDKTLDLIQNAGSCGTGCTEYEYKIVQKDDDPETGRTYYDVVDIEKCDESYLFLIEVYRRCTSPSGSWENITDDVYNDTEDYYVITYVEDQYGSKLYPSPTVEGDLEFGIDKNESENSRSVELTTQLKVNGVAKCSFRVEVNQAAGPCTGTGTGCTYSYDIVRVGESPNDGSYNTSISATVGKCTSTYTFNSSIWRQCNDEDWEDITDAVYTDLKKSDSIYSFTSYRGSNSKNEFCSWEVGNGAGTHKFTFSENDSGAARTDEICAKLYVNNQYAAEYCMTLEQETSAEICNCVYEYSAYTHTPATSPAESCSGKVGIGVYADRRCVGEDDNSWRPTDNVDIIPVIRDSETVVKSSSCYNCSDPDKTVGFFGFDIYVNDNETLVERQGYFSYHVYIKDTDTLIKTLAVAVPQKAGNGHPCGCSEFAYLTYLESSVLTNGLSIGKCSDDVFVIIEGTERCNSPMGNEIAYDNFDAKYEHVSGDTIITSMDCDNCIEEGRTYGSKRYKFQYSSNETSSQRVEEIRIRTYHINSNTEIAFDVIKITQEAGPCTCDCGTLSADTSPITFDWDFVHSDGDTNYKSIPYSADSCLTIEVIKNDDSADNFGYYVNTQTHYIDVWCKSSNTGENSRSCSITIKAKDGDHECDSTNNKTVTLTQNGKPGCPTYEITHNGTGSCSGGTVTFTVTQK